MANILKQIFSLILPITVLIVVPRSIEKDWTININIYLFAGSLVALVGLSIIVVCISSFIRIGKGTLAPWAPTKKLVVTGLYRYVRNPMILGVFIVLLGEALALRSLNILIWAALFFIINTIYFIVFEEPDLENRFGDEYREYKQHVSRWRPRREPYDHYQNEKP